MSSPVKSPVFTLDGVKDNFKYYTGFTYMRFGCIFQFLVPSSVVSPINFPNRLKIAFKMKLQDQLLLTLVKLRLNLEFKHLAYLFKISSQDAGQLFDVDKLHVLSVWVCANLAKSRSYTAEYALQIQRRFSKYDRYS